MTTEEFEAMLNKHDWWYSNSDDPKIWTKGLGELTKIQQLAKDNPTFNELYQRKKKEIFNLK